MDARARAAVAAIAGGIGWAAVSVAWVVAHGSTQSPRGDTILSIDATGLWGLLALPAFVLSVALASARPALGSLGRIAGAAYMVALASIVAVAASLVLQTAIVDPDLDFGHPAVQGGWLLYLAALVPGLAVSMTVLGLTLLRRGHALGSATLVVGLAAAAPVVGAALHGVADGSPTWDAAVAATDAVFGVAWIAFGWVLRSEASAPRQETRPAA